MQRSMNVEGSDVGQLACHCDILERLSLSPGCLAHGRVQAPMTLRRGAAEPRARNVRLDSIAPRESMYLRSL